MGIKFWSWSHSQTQCVANWAHTLGSALALYFYLAIYNVIFLPLFVFAGIFLITIVIYNIIVLLINESNNYSTENVNEFYTYTLLYLTI